MSERSGIASIQALRGIAALMVVLWHASNSISPYGSGLGTTLFGAGWAMGVDLFFVISGFIMVYTTRASDGSPQYAKRFFIKRFTRIWPTYVVMTVLYVLLSSVPLAAYLEGRPIQRILLTAAFLPTAMAPSPPMFELPMLRVGWSLNYEMYFYAVFGLCLLLGRLRWIGFFGWMALTLIAVRILRGTPLLDAAADPHFPVAYLNLMANPIIWLFVAGVAIGLMHQSGWRIENRTTARAALLLASCLAAWQYATHSRLANHGIHMAGLTVIPLVLVAVVADKAAQLRLPRPLTFLGDISFSLYLVHPIVKEGMDWLFSTWGVQSRFGGFDHVAVATAVSIALAALSHRLLEQGLSGWLKDRLLGSPAAVARPLSGRRMPAAVADPDPLAKAERS